MTNNKIIFRVEYLCTCMKTHVSHSQIWLGGKLTTYPYLSDTQHPLLWRCWWSSTDISFHQVSSSLLIHMKKKKNLEVLPTPHDSKALPVLFLLEGIRSWSWDLSQWGLLFVRRTLPRLNMSQTSHAPPKKGIEWLIPVSFTDTRKGEKVLHLWASMRAEIYNDLKVPPNVCSLRITY